MSIWTCDKCGLTLKNVKPPVRHACKPQARHVATRAARASRYITTAELTRDTLALMPRLSGIDCVVGVARSGLIPASLIATHLSCDLWSLDHRTGDLFSLGHGHRHQPRDTRQRVLLVDDSCWSGTALSNAVRWVKEHWSIEPETLAVYVRPQVERRVKHWAASLGDHWFEWNLFNAPFVQNVAFDFDGVLCRDFLPHEDDDGERYIKALLAMEPTHRRPQKPVRIVTARLAKYGPLTEHWLAKHGIPTERLVMGPWASKQERDAADVWQWKADEIRRLGVSLYVESSDHGAREIARLARVHAIATDTGATYYPPAQVDVDPSGCTHRGESLGTIQCRGCGGTARQVEVFACAIHGKAHLDRANDPRAGMDCRICARSGEGFEPR